MHDELDIFDRLKGQQPVIDNPEELTDRIMNSLPEQDVPVEKQEQRRRRLVPISWRWTAAAACLLIVIGIGVSYQFSDSPQPVSQPTTVKQSIDHAQAVNRTHPVSQPTTLKQSIEHAQAVNRTQPISQQSMAMEEEVLEIQVPTEETEPEVVYASVEVNKDTVFKAPAMMEEFVEKMAEFCKAEKADLDCLKSKDDSTQNRIYVIEDSQENGVFERLIQMAVWYDNNAPGYFLTFSQKQFLFQLHDPKLNMKYFVMAERINAGRILLYYTHISLGNQFNMACYLEYRNKLNEGKLIIDN